MPPKFRGIPSNNVTAVRWKTGDYAFTFGQKDKYTNEGFTIFGRVECVSVVEIDFQMLFLAMRWVHSIVGVVEKCDWWYSIIVLLNNIKFFRVVPIFKFNLLQMNNYTEEGESKLGRYSTQITSVGWNNRVINVSVDVSGSVAFTWRLAWNCEVSFVSVSKEVWIQFQTCSMSPRISQ